MIQIDMLNDMATRYRDVFYKALLAANLDMYNDLREEQGLSEVEALEEMNILLPQILLNRILEKPKVLADTDINRWAQAVQRDVTSDLYVEIHSGLTIEHIEQWGRTIV